MAHNIKDFFARRNTQVYESEPMEETIRRGGEALSLAALACYADKSYENIDYGKVNDQATAEKFEKMLGNYLDNPLVIEITKQSIVSAIIKKADVFEKGFLDADKIKEAMAPLNQLSNGMLNKIRVKITPSLANLPESILEEHKKTLISNIAHELNAGFRGRGNISIKSVSGLYFSAVKKVGKMMAPTPKTGGGLTISTSDLQKIAHEIEFEHILKPRENNTGHSR